ncbi:MAG: hypothetical protein HZA66_13275 [Rhodopseudomonas palustris]|uniref:Uncharacterized protein n=1 Tax=Rhodopseudomonas palustris TaxID=1076 RepID=A0A933RXU6_RHOPL|nr:hypothetical protein [Rhodopseudomonas palustris]
MHVSSSLAALVVAVGLVAAPAAGLAQTASDARAAHPAPATAAPASPPSTADRKGGEKQQRPKTATRRQEIEHAIETRTVPSRYRNSVPKEYQKYIPFAK